MNLAYKKILGKFTKVLGFGKTPPPPPNVGKNSQIISFFFYESVPNVYRTFHRALGLSTSPYLKKLSQKMQEGVAKNSENPIKVAGCPALIYISICRDCSSHQMTQAIQKQLGFLPSITAAIAEKKEEALRELKAR